ncbi:hypothetical protein [Spartinivicinus poritis]|uniref:Uncharacterized protein n=1 Tax=Spartinivicinus poritis TaxID=2994640 RepID=A0ABT5UB42_9GAMM|nr:hypothetical protein [Spartinivicinus sp. A2-2]MDE1463201.1 hypothetical protein [Spartinivicinus sp. A2-2]
MVSWLWKSWLLLGWLVIAPVGWGSETAGRYKIYTESSVKEGKPIAIKLDTFTGDSWFFNGDYWQKMKETGAKNNYQQPSYLLSISDSKSGLVIFRFSTVNGSGWSYGDNGWEYIHNEAPKQEEPN